ncbi:MAG: AmmeMemoRadiSam system protein B [Deltaproteobacteria bacterium]|nr:AmmeMemoRadiSam system protein B [Deltaproteobacteria bacterium]
MKFFAFSAFFLLLIAVYGGRSALGGTNAETIPPQVVGTFYPADKTELRKTVDSLINEAPNASFQGELTAALVPHAGYAWSGKTAAHIYRLLKGRRYDTVIIVGTGHRVYVKGAATVAAGSFSTPLGEVPIDEEAVKKLMGFAPPGQVAPPGRVAPLVQNLPEAYKGEHSVEVQLPFLQVVLGNFKVVPLLMNNVDTKVASQIGSALAQLMQSGKTLLLVSSDLSHYPDKETARIVDETSLMALQRSYDDPEYFLEADRLLMAKGRGKNLVVTFCGEAGLLAALYAMKELGGTGPAGAQSRLLAYTNSGELAGGEPGRAVGYSALIWTRGGLPPPKRGLNEMQRKTLLALARETLTRALIKGEKPESALWKDPAFNLPSAVFVTLRKKGVPRSSSLRGCIGSLVPNLPLAEAVEIFALKSALEDSRFSPVTPDELNGIGIEISILSPFRKISSASEVKPGQGVMVGQGRHTGLFLPQVWEDIPDKKNFLVELCRQKAGLPEDCWKDPRTEIRVFDAEAFEEE